MEKDSPINRSINESKNNGCIKTWKYLVLSWMKLYIDCTFDGREVSFDEKTLPTKHTHLTFETPHHYVHYLDTRKFSRMSVTNDLSRYFGEAFELEPFDDALTVDYLK